MKISLSGAGISQFFANNVEKLILAATCAVLLAFIYGAITAKPLDSETPYKIKTESNNAIARVNEISWPPPDRPGVTSTNFAASIEKNLQEVQIARLEQGHDWDPRLFPELVKRADPEVYGVQELRIATGCGIVPYSSTVAAALGAGPVRVPTVPEGYKPIEPGLGFSGVLGIETPEARAPQQINSPSQANLPGARVSGQSAEPKAKYCAILTGLVPLEKQALEYKRRFEYAVKDPVSAARAQDGNAPEYLYCLVERAEVKDENDGNLKWTPVEVRAAYEETTKWATTQGSGEIIDPAYVLWQPFTSPEQPFSLITWPLPPLLLRDWGLEAAHPKVRLSKPYSETTQPGEIEKPFNPFDPNAHTGAAAPVGPNQTRQPRPTAPGYSEAPPPGMGGSRDPMYLNRGRTGVEQGPSVPYALFRYIDLTAEPGKTYRYRVQLVLRNPNYNIHPQYLQNAETSKQERRQSSWSEPTPPVTIPPEARILADTVVVSRSQLTEPTMKTNVLALVDNTREGGLPSVVEALKELSMSLGMVTHFRDEKIEKVIDVVADQIRDIEHVTLNARDSLLLDVRNDDPLGLTSRSKGPCELLLMDPTGRLRVANSASDSLVARDYKLRTEIPVVAPVEGNMPQGAFPPRR